MKQPAIGQKVNVGHCSVAPKETHASIIEVISPTKVRVKNELGEATANWYPADRIDHEVLPYGEYWCYPA